MNKKILLLCLVFLSSCQSLEPEAVKASKQDDKNDSANRMSNVDVLIKRAQNMDEEAIWHTLQNRDAKGRTIFGLCSIWFHNDHTYFGSSPSFQIANGQLKWLGWQSGPATGTLGLPGWPKNPETGDSTGIADGGCYPGYSPDMCTGNVKSNVKAMLLDALKTKDLTVLGITYNDVCGLDFEDPIIDGPGDDSEPDLVEALIQEAESMSNEDVYTALTTRDEDGLTKFGLCSVWINNSSFYFGSSPSFAMENGVLKWLGWQPGPATGTLGLPGWPKNPFTGDSTGISNGGCYPGYTQAMCTTDVKANIKAQLLDALKTKNLTVKGITYNDVCGLRLH
jgi:hypothetical protein